MPTLSFALRFLFYPLPSRLAYTSPTLLLLLLLCVGLLVLAFVVRFWRSRLQNASLKKLSKSWGAACIWFGLTGLVLVAARGEGIQYVAMRFWWLLWALAALAYVFIQFRLFRARHYQVIPTARVVDPRDDYLPKAKRK